MSPRLRPVALGFGALVLAWALALAGFAVARHLQVTPEKLTALLASTDLAKLSSEQRRAHLERVAEWLNRLGLEERRSVRLGPAWEAWFRELSQSEKGELMERTLPTGFNQMLTAFEEMPPDRRRAAIETTVRRLQEAREQLAEAGADPETGEGGERPEEVDPELREKMVALGVKTFLDQGSPETKAELQPMLEELQRGMESGRLFRNRRGPGPPP